MSALPEWTYSDRAGFGEDFDALAEEVFAQPYRGLWRTGAGERDGFGQESGLVAVTNSDLRRLMVHPALTNVPADVLSGMLVPAGGRHEDSGYYKCFAHSVFTRQPPEHASSKKLFARQLTAGALSRHHELAASLLRDGLRSLAGRGECDLRTDFAEPAVARFWGEVLGLSYAEAVRVSELAVGLQAANDFRLSADGLVAVNQAGESFLAEFNALLRRGIRRGGVDFLDDLVADYESMEADQRPSSLEAHFGVSLIDGLHTLPAEIVSTVYTLCMNPSSRAAVRADETLVADAYHEAIRLHPGIVSTQRYAMTDFEFDGVEVPKGTLIMMLWLFGNRDPDVYDSPGEFRLGRGHRSDTTFGGGAYICPGRNIVKLFCQLALKECTCSGVEITFCSEPEWSTASAIHEPMRAPVVIEVS